MSQGRLLVCATPIGNLGDVSDRLRGALASADVIYAEDTRRTVKLLSHLSISTPLRSLFVGNEAVRTEELIDQVAEGKTVAIVSDAGMPTISDPGSDAVRGVRDRGFPVVVVPGPSAVTTAIALAGFGGDRFAFEGFLPRRGEQRANRLHSIASDDRVVVLFASPRRLDRDLADLRDACGGEREVVVTRELTKLHEEVWVGKLIESVGHWSEDVKGEVTLVLGPGKAHPPSVEDAVQEASDMIADGFTVSDAARRVASRYGVSRRTIYQALLDNQDSS